MNQWSAPSCRIRCSRSPGISLPVAVGGALTFFGVTRFYFRWAGKWLGRPISPVMHLPLWRAACGVATCLASLHGMRNTTIRKVRRTAAFVTGCVVSLFGVMGFFVELGKRASSSTHFSGYLTAVVLLSCGALICVAVRLNYGGGLWALTGLLLLAAGVSRLVSAWQAEAHGRFLISPVPFYTTTVGLCGCGVYCLSWGHLRRRGESKKALNENG